MYKGEAYHLTWEQCSSTNWLRKLFFNRFNIEKIPLIYMIGNLHPSALFQNRAVHSSLPTTTTSACYQ